LRDHDRSLLRTLYFLLDFCLLWRAGRSHCDGARPATDSMVGAIQELLRPSRAVVVPADVRAGRVQRQRAEVDASHAGADHRAGLVPSVPALHYSRAMGRRSRLAPAARRGAGGALILDSTSFPKQGPHSVGVARQYCGALGKIANCQVAVTAAVWTGMRAWFLGAALYLPEEWLSPGRRTQARIPAAVGFESKWRQALRLVRQLRAAGFTLTAVIADAEFGDVTTFRAALHRLRLPVVSHFSAEAIRACRGVGSVDSRGRGCRCGSTLRDGGGRLVGRPAAREGCLFGRRKPHPPRAPARPDPFDR
jgi:DDE superfamily endonuclease